MLNDLWAEGHAPWKCGAERALGARDRRRRPARLVAGQGAARAGRARGGDPPRRAGRLRCARSGSPARSTSSTATSAPTGCRPRAQRVRGRQRLPSRGADAGGNGQPLAACDVRDQHPRHLDGARGMPAGTASSGSSSPPRTRPTAASPSSPTARTMPLDPPYPYDVSKAAADMLARSYWHTFGLPVAVTRFANLYGGGDTNRSRLVPEAVCAALAGARRSSAPTARPSATSCTSRTPPRAYLAIWEALAAGGAARGEAFNAGGGEPRPRARRGRADLPAGRVIASRPTSAARASPTARSTASGSTRPSSAS